MRPIITAQLSRAQAEGRLQADVFRYLWPVLGPEMPWAESVADFLATSDPELQQLLLTCLIGFNCNGYSEAEQALLQDWQDSTLDAVRAAAAPADGLADRDDLGAFGKR